MTAIDLSVIVPHWQNATDLRRLLASIPNDARFETIVVDDYSDYGCFSQVAALKDEFRFTLLKNTGKKSAGTCRNIGFANAHGKWVLFADSDDFFLETLKDEFYRHYNSDCDIIFFPPKGIFADTLEPNDRGKNHAEKIKIYVNNPSRANELALRLNWNCPWSKLYSVSFLTLNSIWFEEVIASNDVRFSTESGIKANKIGVSETSIYCSTARRGSLENIVSKSVIAARMRVAVEHRNICRKIGAIEYTDSALNWYFAGRRLKFYEWLWLTKLAKKLGVFDGFSLTKFAIMYSHYLRRKFSAAHKKMQNLRQVVPPS